MPCLPARVRSTAEAGVSTLAITLRRLRQMRGFTQTDLGLQAGFDRAYVSRIESGKQGATFEFAERMAEVMELDAWDRARLLVAAGHWPWPGVSLDYATQLLDCGDRMYDHLYEQPKQQMRAIP